MSSNVKQETERLYRCIMHDFHDGKDRQEMWEREIQLVINQQVIQALEKAKSEAKGIGFGNGEMVSVNQLEDLIKEYKGDKG